MPKLPIRTTLLAALIGIVVGITGGLFGLGGGIVAVPALVFAFKLSQHRAHATSVAAIVVTAAAATLPFAFEDELDWSTAGLLAIGAGVGAVLGAGLMGRVKEVTLARAFLVLTLVAGVRLLMLSDATTGAVMLSGPIETLLLVLTGLVAGTLAALLGVGGGLIFVPALVVLFGFDQHLAQGTSLAAIVPTTIIASIRHAVHGRVDWQLAIPVGVGGVGGGFLGAALALEIAPQSLRRLFVGLLVIVSIRMVRRIRSTQA